MLAAKMYNFWLKYVILKKNDQNWHLSTTELLNHGSNGYLISKPIFLGLDMNHFWILWNFLVNAGIGQSFVLTG